MTDALQLLRDDHKRVKDLFSQFESADDTRTKGDLVKRALLELEIHAEIEEEIFYPAVRAEADTDEDMMNEADEEHHVVKMLMAELRRMKPGADHYDAKFTVLAENVKHHIGEEESEMLPKAAELGMARMNELGAEMEKRKTKLEAALRTSGSSHGARKTAATRTAKPATRTTRRAAAGTAPKRTSTTRTAATSARASSKPDERRAAAAATRSTRTTASRRAPAAGKRTK